MGDELKRNAAAGSGPRLDEELLPERSGELVRGEPRQDIGGAARCEAIDDPHRPARPLVGAARGRHHCRGKPRYHQQHVVKPRHAPSPADAAPDRVIARRDRAMSAQFTSA